MGSARTVFVADATDVTAAGQHLGANTTLSDIDPNATTGSLSQTMPHDVDEDMETVEAAVNAPAAATPSPTPTPAPVEPEAAPVAPPPEPPTAPATGVSAKLIMLGPDGQPIGERVLLDGETIQIGRAAGPPWEDDAYLDNEHASLAPTADGLEVSDFDSLNGIFVKLTARVEIQSGDQFRVGQELLLYEDLPEPTPTDDGTERMGSPNPGYWGRVSILVDPEHASAAFPIDGDGIQIGRESGDITFPQDGYVSGSHCHIVGDDQGVYMEDLGSSNGTYMRARAGQVVPYGSLVLIGQKLFQLERT